MEAEGATTQKEPAVPSLSHRDLTHLGMYVHKDNISVGILRPDEESPESRGSSTTSRPSAPD
jgi:hypothetical protein